MIGKSGLSAIDSGRLDELFPASVSQEGKKAQTTSAPQMTVNLRCRLLVLLKKYLVREGGCMLEEDFLRSSRLKVDLLDERDQLLPGLFVGTAIFSGIDGGQFPS